MTMTTIPKLKLFSENKIIKVVLFYIKTLDRFQDNVRFPIFEHILNLNHCRGFETKPIFRFLSIIHKAHMHNLQNKSKKVKIII